MNEAKLTYRKLYPKKTSLVLLMLLSLAFTAVGIYMVIDEESIGWLCAIFFGLCLIVSIVNMLPQASYLVLDQQGFETCSLFKKHRYSWDDVHHFGVGMISNNKMVMFDFSQEYQKARKLRELSSFLAGAEGALHDTFGMKAEELAELMNAYKRESVM